MTEKREEARIAYGEFVSCSANGKVASHRLIDLSTGGCKIVSDSGLASMGDAIEVTLLDGVAASGTVAWVKDGTMGVKFDTPVNPAMVRYFEITKHTDKQVFRPTDRFGRAVPPLSGLTD